MTRNRLRKAEIRAHQAATGTAYMVARRQLTPPTLAEVMEQHPLLNSFGIGVFAPHLKTPEQRRTELAARREELAGQEATVLETTAWLRENITPIKTPTVGSYAMKHVMERVTGRYVTNGEFIAAAIIADYAFKYTEGPNVQFGMSARDIKRIEASGPVQVSPDSW
jgi:hypothetical protein